MLLTLHDQLSAGSHQNSPLALRWSERIEVDLPAPTKGFPIQSSPIVRGDISLPSPISRSDISLPSPVSATHSPILRLRVNNIQADVGAQEGHCDNDDDPYGEDSDFES
jgi:hypothetical protein